MLIRPLFKRYQEFLVKFANTKFGRSYLGIKYNLPIVKVSPDGIHFDQGNGLYQAVFYPKSFYLKKFRMALEGLAIVEQVGLKLKKFLFDKPEYVIPHFQGLTYASWLPLLERFEYTAEINPDADLETTSVDGGVYIFISPSANAIAWAAARSNDGVTHNTLTNSNGATAGQGWATGNIDAQDKCAIFGRVYILFDSSSLGSAAVVNSGTLSLFGGTKKDTNSDDPTFNIYAGTPASNTDIAATDFAIANFGSTAFSTAITHDNWSVTSYNDFTLNTNGLAAIDTNGISKFSRRWDGDVDNSKPKNGNNQSFNATVLTADNGSNQPKLEVVYVPPFYGGMV